MRKGILLLAVLVGVASGLWHDSGVQAARGAPGSGEFGYGARLNLDGPYFDDALDLAVDLPVDWLAVTLRWSALVNPQSSDWQRFDKLMSAAARANISVLVSLTSAPPSAQTVSGPDAAQTAQFILSLAQRSGSALQAVELFPAANTRAGWGAQPDPAAYAKLFGVVQEHLRKTYPQITLSAAGLQPVNSSSADINDLTFLAGLYAANPALGLPVISIQLTDITADPLAPPAENDTSVLRHYEQVRAVMLQNGRQNDLIWVTSFQLPSGTMNMPDRSSQGVDAQKRFFVQAQTQMRSQLYIGMTIYNSLNPAADLTGRSGYLVTDPSEYHPMVTVFREMIAQNSPSTAPHRNGRPKTEALIKNRH